MRVPMYLLMTFLGLLVSLNSLNVGFTLVDFIGVFFVICITNHPISYFELQVFQLDTMGLADFVLDYSSLSMGVAILCDRTWSDSHSPTWQLKDMDLKYC
jgi:hypothetical protein